MSRGDNVGPPSAFDPASAYLVDATTAPAGNPSAVPIRAAATVLGIAGAPVVGVPLTVYGAGGAQVALDGSGGVGWVRGLGSGAAELWGLAATAAADGAVIRMGGIGALLLSLDLQTAGTTRLSVAAAAAEVGIGMGPIAGAGLAVQATGGAFGRTSLTSNNGRGALNLLSAASVAGLSIVNDGSWTLGTVEGHVLRFHTSNVERARCAAAGSEWGFGTTPTSGYSLTGQAGTSGAKATVGGRLASQLTDVGNVGAGEDTAYTYSLPANALNVNGRGIVVRGIVQAAALPGGTTLTVRVKFGATTVHTLTLVASGISVFTVRIVRIDATTQRAFATLSDTAGGGAAYTTPGETLSGAVTVLVTLESSAGVPADNDLILRLATVDLEG